MLWVFCTDCKSLHTRNEVLWDQNVLYTPQSYTRTPAYLFAQTRTSIYLVVNPDHNTCLPYKATPIYLFTQTSTPIYSVINPTQNTRLPYKHRPTNLVYHIYTQVRTPVYLTYKHRSEHHIYLKLKPQQKFMSCFVQRFVMLILMHAFIVLALFWLSSGCWCW